MKSAAAIILTLLALITQFFLRPMEFSFGELRIFLLYACFYTAVLTINYPFMLAFAILVGLLWDTPTAPIMILEEINGKDASMLITQSRSDLSFGYSAMLFGFFGAIVQGVKPLYERNKVLLPGLMVFAALFFHVAAEYLLSGFMRGTIKEGVSFSNWVTYSCLANLAIVYLLLNFFLGKTLKEKRGKYRVERSGSLLNRGLW